MALEYTYKNNVSLALAVFLMYDNYEYDERPNAFSATGLIKPLRQLILSKQNPALLKTVDIADLVSTRMGSAIHKGCEDAWTDLENVKRALTVSGASEDAINNIRINPPFVKPHETPV